jgi:hypothetical protein
MGYRIEEAINQLRCAEINCDNVKKLGPVMADVVKLQVQTALKFLLEIQGGVSSST